MWRYVISALGAVGFTAVGTNAGNQPEPLPDPLEAGWNGEPVCVRLHEDEHLRVLRCSFPPGVGHERHYHPPHVGYVLTGGSMQVTDAEGTRTIDIPDGYTFSNPDGIAWHEALNVGDRESTYLMIEPKQAAVD